MIIYSTFDLLFLLWELPSHGRLGGGLFVGILLRRGPFGRLHPLLRDPFVGLFHYLRSPFGSLPLRRLLRRSPFR